MRRHVNGGLFRRREASLIPPGARSIANQFNTLTCPADQHHPRTHQAAFFFGNFVHNQQVFSAEATESKLSARRGGSSRSVLHGMMNRQQSEPLYPGPNGNGMRCTNEIGASGFTLGCWLLLATAHGEDPPRRPNTARLNVVFILVDDLGWSDLGCYGSDFYETPNLDRFSRRSVKFNSAYAAAPVCSPTRAAIMTGKSPARLDMTIWHEGAVGGGPRDRPLRDARSVANLPREEQTLAELFYEAGYVTAHIGKWHLGTAAFYPETQGFMVNVGGTFWGAPSTFFHPYAGLWNRRSSEFRYVPGLGLGRPNEYLPDRLTDEAIKIMQASADRPFYLNLWYYTVHSPIEAPAEIVERFRRKPPGQHHRDPTYAAMVQRMDHNVGRVLDKLDELQLDKRTIVVFTSDNGGVDFEQRSIVPTSNLPLRSGKGTLYEGGIRVPLLIRWPGKGVGETSHLCTSQDFMPTFQEMLGGANDERALDGISLISTLEDRSATVTERTLYWHFPHYYPRMTPGSALREGDWKLVHYYEDDRQELYNLRIDPGEARDLAGERLDEATRLGTKLDRWRRQVGANLPRPN